MRGRRAFSNDFATPHCRGSSCSDRRPACSSPSHTGHSPARQARALSTRAPARIRLPATDVTVSGSGSSQPAREAAQSTAPAPKVRITAAFLRAGPRTSITAPTRTVPAHTARSTPSESASAGAATTRTGVSAQCRPHHAAAHAASRDPEARYLFSGRVAREFFTGSRRGRSGESVRERLSHNDNEFSCSRANIGHFTACLLQQRNYLIRNIVFTATCSSVRSTYRYVPLARSEASNETLYRAAGCTSSISTLTSRPSMS